jgi:hypothetical protein
MVNVLACATAIVTVQVCPDTDMLVYLSPTIFEYRFIVEFSLIASWVNV